MSKNGWEREVAYLGSGDVESWDASGVRKVTAGKEGNLFLELELWEKGGVIHD